jgi:hypothetical protein
MEETKIEIARTQSSTQEQERDQKQWPDNNQARDATRQLNTATLSNGNGR